MGSATCRCLRCILKASQICLRRSRFSTFCGSLERLRLLFGELRRGGGSLGHERQDTAPAQLRSAGTRSGGRSAAGRSGARGPVRPAGTACRPCRRSGPAVRTSRRRSRSARPRSRSSTNSSGLTQRSIGWCRGVGRRYWVIVTRSQPASCMSRSAWEISSRVSPMPRIRFDFVTIPAARACAITSSERW